MQSTLIVILGPTGVGKTEISLQVAQNLQTPIISADSRQIYKELKIGTAAPTSEQLSTVKHYFIGSHSIFENFSAGQFEQEALALLEKHFATNHIALMVGGSMLYIDAVCKGLDNIPTVDTTTRNFWKKQYENQGLEYIRQELKKLDPVYYQQVDPNNYKRILHALEICSITGNPFSALRTGVHKKRAFDIVKIGLNRPRHELYERINARVDQMMEEGLLEEAKQFYAFKNLNPLNTVGYKELFEFMDGKITLKQAVDKIKQNTRHYAKRQLTWFNHDKDITWFHPDEREKIIRFLQNRLS
ncbi:MAG TPA: tRNA (adenosine(37)-N6)-dimethylallyltransferase MiaA [Paludibacteraceae bacterium]|nr:tRNA (adenosine(37)-N6)-dimethylallyltransferase MiaA [Paludibacteraceae bacterium]OPZ02381.1 MAG: tRNA dimethylallyltransferase [Bacteroidetes bacterium ADurb.BinA395]HOF98354.1 tRNA (adenosine(37)-N6)-dimethylallyltransferase MiaA [Paludibacteraceae bacterium]HOJ66427.1 tRNA (adenosine(37)-N6)-dimethylallyltransferase MiaA [Paludibacteraceae bacterium]HOL28983.1 tRNA (adenosine(37)-N6)-dimethylallyltransferase MiaA [Paludibacteraceae bacterium]